MSRGDHVFVRRGRRYTHHGIDCGDGTVVHFSGGRRPGRLVERTTMADFAGTGEVHVRVYRHRLTNDEVVANAESRLGQQDYHLVRNNCEHLATWASTGSSGSRQVRGWALAAPGAFASAGVADLAGIHLMILSLLSLGAYAVVRPFRRRAAARRPATT